MELVKNASKNNFCHDCAKEIIVNGENIENGVFLSYEDSGSKINIFKCNECFAENKSLANFRECEVYSRVVGYIRPVQQWHKGKKQEYQERKEYLFPKC
ncbi:MAG: anaerobic ribonucleoside-triphosphate reductase [Patescibacteria group bacterium]